MIRFYKLAFVAMICVSNQAQSQQNIPNPPPNQLGKEQISADKKVAQKPKNSQLENTNSYDDLIEQSISEIEKTQLSNDQIERLKKLYIRKEKNKAIPYVSPAKPITRTLPINVEPGVSPPVIRLTRGMQTSIAFSDANAQPWFIKDVSLNRSLFCDGHCNGQGAAADKTPTNILTLEPLNPAAYGNVTVTMNGMSTPIIFILASAQDEVDMRIDAKIPGPNPDAIDMNASIKLMPSIDGVLVNFLDGVPPSDAQVLKVSGMDGVEAWLYRENLYVKCKATAQYPAYVAAARSTSGVSVYRFANLHNSVTFLNGGQAVTVFIE